MEWRPRTDRNRQLRAWHLDQNWTLYEGTATFTDGSTTVSVSGFTPASTMAGHIFELDSGTRVYAIDSVSGSDITLKSAINAEGISSPAACNVRVMQNDAVIPKGYRLCDICGHPWPLAMLRRNDANETYRIVCPDDFDMPTASSPGLSEDGAQRLADIHEAFNSKFSDIEDTV